jgi:hypothetical protein
VWRRFWAWFVPYYYSQDGLRENIHRPDDEARKKGSAGKPARRSAMDQAGWAKSSESYSLDLIGENVLIRGNGP